MDELSRFPDFLTWREVLALYIERMRHRVPSWAELCRHFGLTPKTVRGIRRTYGIDKSVGPKARPSPNFRLRPDHFHGEGI